MTNEKNRPGQGSGGVKHCDASAIVANATDVDNAEAALRIDRYVAERVLVSVIASDPAQAVRSIDLFYRWFLGVDTYAAAYALIFTAGRKECPFSLRCELVAGALNEMGFFDPTCGENVALFGGKWGPQSVARWLTREAFFRPGLLRASLDYIRDADAKLAALGVQS